MFWSKEELDALAAGLEEGVRPSLITSRIPTRSAGAVSRRITAAREVRASNPGISWREALQVRERQPAPPREHRPSPLRPYDDEIAAQYRVVPAREIAREMTDKLGQYVTKNAVIGRMNRIGRGAPRPTPSSIDDRLLWRQANTNGCRWIYGEPGCGQEWHYCGKPLATPNGSWCPEHHARVWLSPDNAEAEDAGDSTPPTAIGAGAD